MVETEVVVVGRGLASPHCGWRFGEHALPAQPSLLRTTSPPRASPSVYVCDDQGDTASTQGALVSGHRVAGAALADLASA